MLYDSSVAKSISGSRLDSQVIEGALGVSSDSEEAVIAVLDKNGNLVSQVHGRVTTARMREITDAL
jgi:hypothetical protein